MDCLSGALAMSGVPLHAVRHPPHGERPPAHRLRQRAAAPPPALHGTDRCCVPIEPQVPRYAAGNRPGFRNGQYQKTGRPDGIYGRCARRAVATKLGIQASRVHALKTVYLRINRERDLHFPIFKEGAMSASRTVRRRARIVPERCAQTRERGCSLLAAKHRGNRCSRRYRPPSFTCMPVTRHVGHDPAVFAPLAFSEAERAQASHVRIDVVRSAERTADPA